MAKISHAFAASRRKRRAFCAAVALTVAASACGKVQSSGPAAELGPAAAGEGAEAGADGAMAGGAGAADCPVGVPSAAELAATPRTDTNLELLALRHSSGIVADAAVYARIVRDVTAIRTADPSVLGIDYFPGQDGRTLSLEVDPGTFDQMKSGAYHAWDCLNQSYVVTHLEFDTFDLIHTQNALVTFKGIYEITDVAEQYASLPGVSRATYGGGQGGDGPTICLTRDADQWHYVFDQAGGDCPAGCTEHVYHHFSTSADGQITSLGDLMANEAAIYASYAGCRGPDRPSAP